MNDNQEYEIQLLSMNLAKIILKKEEKLVVSFVKSDTNEVIWSDRIMIQEWCNEISLNIERFIVEILRVNSVLLNANLIQRLTKVKDILDKK